MGYVFMTDSDSDLPFALKQAWQIPVVYMPYTVDGQEYYDDLGQSLDHKAYYDRMRAGAVVRTSALNEQDYLDYFEPILKENDLLFVAFSSQMSRTIESVYAARERLLKKYPERKFVVVDTLSISVPMTMLLIQAHDLYLQGKPMEEVAAWIEQNRTRSCCYLTVDSLEYLKRGGRLSGAAAAIGTLLDLKPVLTLTKEGKLVACDKIRGRKKALNYIVEKTLAQADETTDKQPIYVIHADAPEDAQRVRDMLAEKFPAAELRDANIGPVIGAHAGPGTVCICFMGKERAL